jgi:hypothetical protein
VKTNNEAKLAAEELEKIIAQRDGLMATIKGTKGPNFPAGTAYVESTPGFTAAAQKLKQIYTDAVGPA